MQYVKPVINLQWKKINPRQWFKRKTADLATLLFINVWNRQTLGWIYFQWRDRNLFQNHLHFEDEQNSCGFGTTWGWVNDDRTFIFVWAIPLSSYMVEHYSICDYKDSFVLLCFVMRFNSSSISSDTATTNYPSLTYTFSRCAYQVYNTFFLYI